MIADAADRTLWLVEKVPERDLGARQDKKEGGDEEEREER